VIGRAEREEVGRCALLVKQHAPGTLAQRPRFRELLADLVGGDELEAGADGHVVSHGGAVWRR